MEARLIIPTVHAQERAEKRGITRKMVSDTINYGEKIHKQGLEYFVMLKKCIQDEWDSSYSDRVVHTTVIIGDDRIVTVYKNRKAFKNIRKKSKRLQ